MARKDKNSDYWQTLNRLILEDINRHAAIAAHHCKRYMEMLTQASINKNKQETGRQKRELKKAGKRIAELEKILVKLYEDRALGADRRGALPVHAGGIRC